MSGTLDEDPVTVAIRGAPALAGFSLNGEVAVPDVTGALSLPDHGVLVVSDLHFEKGSSYATRGVFLPPYDTAVTLARLALAVSQHAPKIIVALGDSFHDRQGGARMNARDREALRALQAGRDWIWIAGNHDPDPPQDLGGSCAETVRFGSLTLRHEPLAGAPGEIAGHLHPVARVASPSGSVRRRCFVSDGERCVMPAFGALTGGLNFLDEAFAPLFGAGPVTAHVIGRAKVYGVPRTRCLGD